MTAAEVWDALRKTVREAHLLGAEFRIIGADVEISGLPQSVREKLPGDLLFAYFGGTRTDKDACTFLADLGVAPILVMDLAGAEAAMLELTGCDPLAIDIETAPLDTKPEPIAINGDGSVAARQAAPHGDGLDPYRADIATLQLYGGGARCFVFRGAALTYLIDSAWLRRQHLVAHNASFEIAFLRRRSTPPKGVGAMPPVECTMQAAGLLHGVWRRSLAVASQDALGIEPPKTLQTSCWSAPQLSPGQLAYAATDAVLAHRLWGVSRAALEEQGRLAAYQLQRGAIPAVADMELRGLGFDPAQHARQTDLWARELAEARQDYLELTGKPAPAKPGDVREWVAAVAGERLATWPKTPTGELSVEWALLKRLVLTEEPTVKPVLNILSREKLLSTFGPKLRQFINPITGRLHAHYSIAGSKAGRFSCSKPNLQQLPNARAPEFKKAIVARPGYVLVGGDYSQVEMRAAAWISRDPALTRVFEEGRDLHAETAALVAGVPVDEVTRDQRQGAKAVNFGSIYGVGPRTLAENAYDAYGVEMTEVEARTALDRFFRTYRVLDRWRRDHANICQQRGYVEIGCGRVVEAEWEPGKKLSFPQCCNLPVQGIAADAMLRAIALVFRRLRNIEGGLVASVHDELVLEVREADGEAARAILQESMCEAFSVTFPGAPMSGVVEVKLGMTWNEIK